jgi:hypothetical protein
MHSQRRMWQDSGASATAVSHHSCAPSYRTDTRTDTRTGSRTDTRTGTRTDTRTGTSRGTGDVLAGAGPSAAPRYQQMIWVGSQGTS